MDNKMCNLCKHYIEGSEECEYSNRMWITCVNYSKFMLMEENKNYVEVETDL